MTLVNVKLDIVGLLQLGKTSDTICSWIYFLDLYLSNSIEIQENMLSKGVNISVVLNHVTAAHQSVENYTYTMAPLPLFILSFPKYRGTVLVKAFIMLKESPYILLELSILYLNLH